MIKISFFKVILFFLVFGFILFLSKYSFTNFFSSKLIDEFDIQIVEVKIKNKNLTVLKYIDFELVFSLDNTSNIEFQVNELDIEIYKTDNYEEILGNSSIKDSFIIYPETINKVKSEVKVNTLKMGVSLLSNTMNKKHSFFILVNAKVEYKNTEIPITIKRKMNYNLKTKEIELNVSMLDKKT